jgi:predicted MFS family arabinose efflux permease
MKRSYAYYVLGLLTMMNLVNYVDRMVVNTMYPSLREHFGFSDGQLGAFNSAFFLTHALTTVPFGWLADRLDRRRIMAAAVIVWSLATLGSAWALGFVSMLLFRACVGVGEAAYGPVSNALLAESFPAKDKAWVIAIFNGGMFLGACLGMAMGAILGFPDAFYWVAIPGLVLGVQAWFLKVPPRRPGVGTMVRFPGVTTMFRDAWRAIDVPSLRWMLVSGILISFAVGGYITWFVDFVERFKHVSHEQATYTYGAIAASGGVLGVISGGKIADRIMRRRRDGRVLTIGIGFLLAAPFGVAAIYLPNGVPFYICSWLMMFFIPWYNGPMAAVIDDVVDDDSAASAQASFAFLLHLFGTTTGGWLVGFLSDAITLQHALMIPTAAVLAAGLVCFKAMRHVGADMDARAARAAERAQRQAAVL